MPPDFAHVEAILQDAEAPTDPSEFARFRDLGKPPLLDRLSLPRAVGVSPRLLMSIVRRKAHYYRSFEISKRNGEPRTILAPRTFLKVIQWWIVDNIFKDLHFEPDIFGFVRERGHIKNALFHANSTHILNVDIENFFPSIRFGAVKEVFVGLGYSSDVSSQLAELCTFGSCLPQGAPTSPTIANLAAKKLDRSLREIAARNKYRFSRYADDITFSSRTFIPRSFLDDIRQIINHHNFTLKDQKTRFLGPGDRMMITGLVVNEKIQPPRKWRMNARAAFFQSQREPEKFIDRLSELEGLLA